MVLVCIMISTGSQCKNSIGLVFLLIFVLKLFTSDGNRGLWPASSYSLMMMLMMMSWSQH